MTILNAQVRSLGPALASLLLFCAASLAALAQNRPPPQLDSPDLYYLAIGSEDYLYLDGDGGGSGINLSALRGPVNSARRVADALDAAGARHGILLVSDGPTALITRTQIIDAITGLKRRIRRDYKADPTLNPRLVVYFMGHGLGDAAGRNLYLLPGDIVFDNQPTQTVTIKLMKRAVWVNDLMSALVNFRLHPSMRHFDDFLPSQLTPDMTDIQDVMDSRDRRQELERIDAQRRREGAYAPGGNAPVPFIVLLDNCYADVTNDLTDQLRGSGLVALFSSFIDTTIGELLNEGVAYYAAPPGEVAYPVIDPGVTDARGFNSDNIGPVALHFVSALEAARQRGEVLTLAAVKQAFQPDASGAFRSPVHDADAAMSAWRPYDPGARVALRRDVAGAEMILPGAAGRADRLTVSGRGARATRCCR